MNLLLFKCNSIDKSIVWRSDIQGPQVIWAIYNLRMHNDTLVYLFLHCEVCFYENVIFINCYEVAKLFYKNLRFIYLIDQAFCCESCFNKSETDGFVCTYYIT